MCWPCNGQEQCLSVSGIKPSLSQHLRSRDLAERTISCRKRHVAGSPGGSGRVQGYTRPAAGGGGQVVVVGLGGSATVDGGTGAACGLGWTFADARGEALPEGGGSLAQLADLGGGWALAAQVLALTDVTTPLVGTAGAAPVFAPQKGAGP